jgi:putative restriction endonuclease
VAAPTGTSFDQCVEAIYDLNVGVVGTGVERHERPHKPLMLLAVLDLIAQGKATPDRVAWSPELRSQFERYFAKVKKRDDQCTPENPFLYLRQEKWWQPVRLSLQGEHPLDGTPTVGDASSGTVFAHITAPLAPWLTQSENRLQLRDAIVARFFPQAQGQLSSLFQEASIVRDAPMAPLPTEDDTEPLPGRSAGFRRKTLEIYDYQCAACGLRIKLPQTDDLTFVDAAHIIPFSVSRNDHPTNGLALCKNHHWAMDRSLIAPTPDRVWRVSRLIEPRRSSGESELRELEGKPILLPHDEAFLPCESALAWRAQRLVA